MQRMDSTIDGAEDLAKQTKIKYGAVVGGSTIRFFQESNFSIYQVYFQELLPAILSHCFLSQRMWAAMETNGDIGESRFLLQFFTTRK